MQSGSEPFKKKHKALLWYSSQQLGELSALLHCFMGTVCLVGVIFFVFSFFFYFTTQFTSVKWMSNSFQQTALQSVSENLSLYFLYNKSPRALQAALLQSACYVYLHQHISLVLWSLFLHRIGLCQTQSALLKWWRGAESVWEGDLLFVWCVYGYCSYSLSASCSRTEKCSQDLIKRGKFSCTRHTWWNKWR